MKKSIAFGMFVAVAAACATKTQEPPVQEETPQAVTRHLYMDVHNLEPGKVTFEAVADAHQKDLNTQDKYDAKFLKYWVDEAAGKVYCLVDAPDTAALYNTHKDAHGLVPNLIQEVTDGPEAALLAKTPLFMDVHYLGAGNVKASDVAGAHEKDLGVQSKYSVNFVNYWVNEKLGVVMCLAEAPDSAAMVNAHKEAHGLIPQEVHLVHQGN